jgi:hypothetical protein
MSPFMRGRRRTLVLVGVALAALTIGVSVGVAKSGPSQLKVPIQYHNANCGVLTTKKFIGKAKVEAHKGVLTVIGKVHGADPGHYRLEVWVPVYSGGVVVDCNLVTGIDEFGVDGGGDGNFAGSVAISGQQSFFITILNEDTHQYNDSPVFKLGGL